MITGIDPGTEKSAVLTLSNGYAQKPRIVPNADLLIEARQGVWVHPVAIEMIACYGMPVGKETFETVLLIGRLLEIFEAKAVPVRLVYRMAVKMHLCHSTRAKDGNVRQALIDKYGPVGTKKNPGKIYGVSTHLWSALAIADYALAHPQA